MKWILLAVFNISQPLMATKHGDLFSSKLDIPPTLWVLLLKIVYK